VIVTMHSAGGLEVAQRLAATLLLLGASVPGAGLVVLADARVGRDGAGPRDGDAGAEPDADTWVQADLATLVHNVLALADARPALRHWPVDAYPALRGPWPATGPLWRGAGGR
jgi:hypothetical protein